MIKFGNVTIETPHRSKLTPEEKVLFEREFKKWQKKLEPIVKATKASQRITAKDLSLTVTI